MTPGETPLESGRMLLHFRLIEPIGQGGMGVVWKALDTTLDRYVALKTLPVEVVQNPDRLARFGREAKFLAALNHPNIATIHGLHECDGIRFLTMELVIGEDLSVRLQREHMSLEAALRVTMEAATAIEAAHARGILHCDLKPGNIRITADHGVKVLDFGVAKALLADVGNAATTLSLTSTEPNASLVLGTPAYMSPEQARGQALDRSSDIWALGCVLYRSAGGPSRFWAADDLGDDRGRADVRAGLAGPPAGNVSVSQGSPRRCLVKDATTRLADVTTARDILANALHSVAAETTMTRRTPSVAVLPFVNIGGEIENQYFCDGLSEELINTLTRVPDLKVASRTSAFRFRGGDQDVRRIGDELGVGSIVEGSVRRAGQRLRVAVQLIDVKDGCHRWSERYDRQMADVFEIQDDIVSSVIAALVPALQDRHPVHRATDNLRAYEIYLKGLHFFHQRSPNTLQVALQSFEQAIALDPDYVLAFTGLADCCTLLAAYGAVPPDEFAPRALAAIDRALALDPTLPEVHFSRGFFTLYFDRQWRNAKPHFENALSQNERSSFGQAYTAIFLAAYGRPTEAAIHIERATLLDPLSPVVHGLSAIAWFVADHLEQAAEAARRALDLQPGTSLDCGLLRSLSIDWAISTRGCRTRSRS